MVKMSGEADGDRLMLLDFKNYLQNNTSLSEKSVNHYESGVRVISKMMYELKYGSMSRRRMTCAF